MSITENRLTKATRVLLESTSGVTGSDFFRGLARGLAQALDVKSGFVGILRPDRLAVETRAVWWDDGFIDNFEYALAGTPCERVVGAMACFFPRDVQALFPSDEMLGQMGIHAYLGVPINGADGSPVGILVALHNSPTPEYDADAARVLGPTFALFADRARLELERLATLASLQKSEAQYRRIVSSTHDGVWLLDRAGMTTFANAQMARMLGVSPDEMIGRSFLDFIAVERRPPALALMARSAEGIKQRNELCFAGKDGRELWTIVSTSELTNDDGAHAGTLALVADLSEVRALESKIVQSQKLESLGLLAGGVAHDFNNLLVGILGNVGLALTELPPTSPLRLSLADAQVAGMRAADLTRQMLAYSGRGRFEVRPLNLNTIVQEQKVLLGAVIAKSSALGFDLALELPMVEADATQLQQVVMNLITNANEALEGRDGVISLSTGVIDVDAAYLASTYLDDQLAPGRYVHLDVQDNGIGMDAATLERIFDPFFTTKFTGRGLGLAALLGILRGHRGAVKVYSEPGKGTKFRILLPSVTSAAELPASSSTSAGSVIRSRRILVVDDEELIRSVAKGILIAKGCEVRVAQSGSEAMSIFIEHLDAIDVVLLDLTMPGMNGEEVYRLMRKLRSDVRIVISSGFDEASIADVVRGDMHGGFLAKPWTISDLLQALEVTSAEGGESNAHPPVD